MKNGRSDETQGGVTFVDRRGNPVVVALEDIVGFIPVELPDGTKATQVTVRLAPLAGDLEHHLGQWLAALIAVRRTNEGTHPSDSPAMALAKQVHLRLAETDGVFPVDDDEAAPATRDRKL